MCKPPVPGGYTITATFEVFYSYGPSFTETAIGVTEEPVLTTELAIISVVIIAIAIIFSIWVTRKRK